ncbi:hypothetical protein HOLleu_36213 [Holothuria leucospilota]|uniref:Uncharacterized protein n=1 Tax=Holothuria leucospilota TaxID=206669 RepID=A0A9Q1BGF6_HOLLE|nr:hypothetical protein HOLleu_36213 [Holothuria leucospilota]
MDCGMGNDRRYINITNILEERRPGLPQALPGYYAFTGCDFTAGFYRKGKVKPLEIVEKDDTGKFVNFFISLGDLLSDGDFDAASEYVCSMYGQIKVKDVDEARYRKLIAMTGKVDQENPLASIKKLDCALLPPTRRTLEMKIRRANYVTMLWTNAATATLGMGTSPCDYG